MDMNIGGGTDGVEPTLNDLLDDPLIVALMRSDGVDRAALEILLAHAAASLAGRFGTSAVLPAMPIVAAAAE